jgi:hypothetical protein
VWTPLQLGSVVTSVNDLLTAATEFLLNKGLIQEDEIVVFSAGVPVGVSGGTNMIKVERVKRGGLSKRTSLAMAQANKSSVTARH